MNESLLCFRLDGIQCICSESGGAVLAMTMRIDNVQAASIRKYAEFEGKAISDLIWDAAFERTED